MKSIFEYSNLYDDNSWRKPYFSVGDEIEHKNEGFGIIISLSEKYVKVKFLYNDSLINFYDADYNYIRPAKRVTKLGNVLL